MAITKTKTLVEVRYSPSQGNDEASAHPMQDLVTGTYSFNIDDPNDDELPIVTTTHFSLKKGDDITGHDQVVQDICNAVWADDEVEEETEAVE